MTSSLIITPATRQDIPDMLRIFAENQLPSPATRTAAELEASGFVLTGFTPREIEDRLVSSTAFVLVAKKQNEVVGYIIGEDMHWLKPEWLAETILPDSSRQTLQQKKSIYLRQIAKTPTAKGIGNPLMHAFIAEATKRQYHTIASLIVLKPFINKISIGMHEKLGFQQHGLYTDEIKTAGLFLKDLGTS